MTMKFHVSLTDDTGLNMEVNMAEEDDKKPRVLGQNIFQEGYMFKCSSSVWRQHWRARYFALTDENLYCYKNKYDFRNFPIEVIQLKGMTMTLEDYAEKNCTRYCIKLTSQYASYSKRTHFLSCYSEEERNIWMTAILQALATKWIVRKESKGEQGSAVFSENRALSRSLDSLPYHTINRVGNTKSDRLADRRKSSSSASTLHPNSKLCIRKAKALSLVENINIRNDFFLQYE